MLDYIAIISDKSFIGVTIEGKEQLDITDITSQSIYSTCIKGKPLRFLNSIKSENTILHYKNNYHANILGITIK